MSLDSIKGQQSVEVGRNEMKNKEENFTGRVDQGHGLRTMFEWVMKGIVFLLSWMHIIGRVTGEKEPEE